MKIAIIGAGKMGMWFADYLVREGMEVILSDSDIKNIHKIKHSKRGSTGQKVEHPFHSTTIATIKKAGVIIISVPQDVLEKILIEISPHTNENQIILDISSIKKSATELLRKYIKKGITLGVHPMFGPGATSIEGHTFILTPYGVKQQKIARKIKKYLDSRGALSLVMSPGKHDELMSSVLGLAHFISIVSADSLVSLPLPQDTRKAAGTTYNMLFTLAGAVLIEDPAFYGYLQMGLPDIDQVENLFLEKAEFWAGLVKNKKEEQFIKSFDDLKTKFGTLFPDFVKSYQKVYQIIETK